MAKFGFVALITFVSSLFMAGCADRVGETFPSIAGKAFRPLGGPTDLGALSPEEATDLGSLIYLGAQTMAERAGALANDRPIVVTTMVRVNDFDKSSTFGRLASQLISNRLAQRGYLVKDVTYMRGLALRPGTGELVLSRDAARVSALVNAQAVVAGTYAVGGREIYLNIRLLKADDGSVLSSADVVIPLDENTGPLLDDRLNSVVAGMN